MKIIKRNGAEESFDTLKIVNAVQKACNATENAYLAPEQLTDIADYVEYKCNKLGRAVSVEEIQDMVENQLIGIPMKTSDLGGVDSLYSIVQMPSGIPVATVAINGGKNAGILAAKILAASDPELLEKLKAYSEKMKTEVESKAEKLDKIGYKEYLASMKK